MAYVVEIKSFGSWRPVNLMYYQTLEQAEQVKRIVINNELAGNSHLCRVRDTSNKQKMKKNIWGLI